MKKLYIIFIISSLQVISISAQTATTINQNRESVQADTLSVTDMLEQYDEIELPPLSVFLESVYDHPSVRIYEERRAEEKALLKDTQSKWLNYFRATGVYQYGQVTGLSKTTGNDDLVYSLSNRAQHQYNAGVAVSIPFGDLVGQKQRNKAQRARINQIEYEYEMSLEERKLRILEAYNKVVEQLATLKAKSDAAALYNAQMKITEQDFIRGTIDITTLSIERSRRTNAVVQYQEGRAALHNAITLLEMLTNVKVMNK